MKKFLLFLCIILTIVFVSCKSTKQDTSDTEIDQPTTEAPAEEEQPAQETPSEEVPAEEELADNSDMMSKAEDARQKAIEAGAKDAYPDAFNAIDSAYEALKALDDGKDHSAALAEIQARYEALEKAANAKKLKERIDSEELAQYAQNDYDRAEKASKEFDALLAIPATPAKALSLKAGETYDCYYSVYFKAYKKFANDQRKAAIESKKSADAVKAQVARKDEYKKCADLVVNGDSCYATSNPEGAYNSYKEAAEAYDALAKDVSEKRAAAQKAIEEAKAKVQSANDYAANADKVNPLGEEHVDGIEAEGTVLLEKDEFASPEEQIIEIKDIDDSVEAEIQKPLEEKVVDAVKDAVRQGDYAK